MRKGWETKRFGKSTSLQGGSQPPKSTFVYSPEEGYVRLLQIRDFNRDDKAAYIPISKKNRTCTDKDILIGRYGASVGRICTGMSGAYNVALMKVTPDEQLFDRKFFLYYLKSPLFQESLMNVSNRSAQNGFNKNDIKDFEVPAPPLPEQKRIVAILDEAFEALDRAKANIEKNIQNAEELFQSKLNEIFSQKGEGWEEKKLEDICTGFQYGTSSKSLQSGDVPVLRMGNIQNRTIDWSDLKYTDRKSEIEKYALEYGDVLFNRTNSPELVGKSAIFRGERRAVFAGYLIRIRGIEGVLRNEYLNFFLNSQKALMYGQSVMTSSVNQANISASKLKEYVVSIPSFEKQIQLESYLSKLDEEINSVCEAYSKKLRNLEELKKSLLQKAFSGELTTNEQMVA